MLRIILITFLLSLNTFANEYISPSDYQYLNEDSHSENVSIKLKNNTVLEFIKSGQECIRYVDSCYLYFDNQKNPDFELVGIDPCYSQMCKDAPANFSNYQLILKKISN